MNEFRSLPIDFKSWGYREPPTGIGAESSWHRIGLSPQVKVPETR